MAANENPNPLWAALVKRCAANTDDYYPSFVANFQPENMATNK